jgi:hypothetical protein
MAVEYVHKYPRKGQAETVTHLRIACDRSLGAFATWWADTGCGKRLEGERQQFSTGYSAYPSIITCKSCLKKMGASS